MDELGTVTTNTDEYVIVINKIPENTTYNITKIINTEGPKLQNYPLENIDKMRDAILQNPGNTAFNITSETNPNLTPYVNFGWRKQSNKRLNTTDSNSCYV